MEPCSSVIVKKLSNMGRVILFSIQKVSEASRDKLMTTAVDLHFLMKRGKILRKSLNVAVSSSQSALSCRPDDVQTSFFSPVPILEYEFSCSSTPPRRSYASLINKKGGSKQPNKRRNVYYPHRYNYNSLPKAGKRSWTRHVAVDEYEGSEADSCHVDRRAEEFIEKFYRQLRLQKWMGQEL